MASSAAIGYAPVLAASGTTATFVQQSLASAAGVWHWRDLVLVIGFLATAAAFLFGFVQLARTRTAAESARDAVGTTAERLAANQLIAIAPQALLVQAEIDALVGAGDGSGVERTLTRWRNFLAQVQGLLPAIEVPDDLLHALQESGAQATQAKQAVQRNKVPLSSATATIAKSVADVAERLTRLATELSTHP